MKTRTIGIVLENVNAGFEMIHGHLAKTRFGIKLDELNRILLEEEIDKIYFRVNTKENTFSVENFETIEEIMEVGGELLKIGLEDLVLDINGQQIKEWNNESKIKAALYP